MARCARFFGGDPMSWFSIPLRIVKVYLAMLPRLRAEESMRRVTESQVAAGRSDEAAEIWDAWKQAAYPSEVVDTHDTFYYL